MPRLVVLGSGLLADLLAKELSTLPEAAVERSEALGSAPAGIDLVVDARRGAAARDGVATARQALEGGAHWIDLARGRERVVAIAELDALAKERGRVALSGCGLFPGLTDPFVRARLADVKRVNEILIGYAIGPGAAWDAADFEDLLAGYGQTIPMLIGGEPTRREFFGDRRWYEHPAPTGRHQSCNVDAPELALYLERPYRSASVRLSLAFTSSSASRAVRFLLWLARKGWVRDVMRHAPRLAKSAGGREGAQGVPTSVTFCLRGTDAKSLPFERRISFQTTRSAATLELLPAAVAARAILGAPGPGKPQAPGARPGVDVVEDTAFEAFAREHGITVRRGDLGGWRQ